MLGTNAFSTRWAALAAGLAVALTAAGCQDYEFVFQPDDDREGTHLRFVVEQPSKADILFVIDNSRGMKPKQEALKASIGKMLEFLAPMDASYRVGIISTDAHGYDNDCNDIPISEGGTQDQLQGNKGACETCWCAIDGTTLDCDSDFDCTGAEVCNTDMPAVDFVSGGRCSLDCFVDPGCRTIDVQADCDASPFCAWSGGASPVCDFVPACPSGFACNEAADPFAAHDCTEFADVGTCNAHPSCAWVAASSNCTTTCAAIPDQGSCDAQAECLWDATGTSCESIYTGRCFSPNCYNCRQYCDAQSFAECEPRVKLRRPHDGAKGRLISAFDPDVFDIDALDSFGQPLYPQEIVDSDGVPKPLLNGGVRTVLANTLYTPPDQNPVLRVPWVIDREVLRRQACDACSCGDERCNDVVEEGAEFRGECCDASLYDAYHADTCAQVETCGDSLLCGQEGTCTTCFEDCAQPVAQGLFTAYFNSNINGLGTDGYGWEEGIKAAMMAVGIDPMAPSVDTAFDPGSTLTRVDELGVPDGPNTFTLITETGQPDTVSWIRPADEALLAIMFVTDEQDCSMSDALMQLKHLFEVNVGEPSGSICYQPDAQQQFIQPDRMAELLLALKEGSMSRLTVGLIGAAQANGPPGRERREARATDCVVEQVAPEENPSTDCACMTLESPAADVSPWCKYTQNTSEDLTLPTCDGMSSSRYVDLVSELDRRTFDSVCRGCPTDGSACDAYGDALVDFARLATLACFELGEIRPAGCSEDRLAFCDEAAALIEVRRAAAEEFDRAAQEGRDPVMTVLSRLEGPDDPDVPDEGAWFYNASENLICLIDLDRIIGDYYEIFVLHRDDQSFSR